MQRLIAGLALALLPIASAAPAWSQRLGAGGTGIDETTALPRCDVPLGTVALVEEKRSNNASGALPPQLAALLELAERAKTFPCGNTLLLRASNAASGGTPRSSIDEASLKG